jgi:hypothetical protein
MMEEEGGRGERAEQAERRETNERTKRERELLLLGRAGTCLIGA